MAFPWMMVAQMGMGAIQTAISASKASQLPDPKQHTVSPELRGAFNEAKTRSQQGYSPAERAAFEQTLARQANASKQMFQNVGMSGAGAAAANIMSIDALNQFAAGSEAARRQNFGQYASLAGDVQRVGDMEAQRFNQRLMAEEQALGGGMQAGISNMFQGLNTGQNVGQMNKAMDVYQGMGTGGGGGVQMPSFKPSQSPSMGTPQQSTPMWGGFGGNYFGNQQQTGFNQASLPNSFQFYNFGG